MVRLSSNHRLRRRKAAQKAGTDTRRSNPVVVTRTTQSPITALLTNERAGVVQAVELADEHELAQWLAEHYAEHRGRVGFLVPRGGEVLRVVLMREGIQWGWRFVQDRIVPLFERQRRVASVPRLSTPGGPFSEHVVEKAEIHNVRETRHHVISGESGKTYTVTLRSGTSPQVACTCPHGVWQARRRQDARCSHAAAVRRDGVGESR